MKTYPWQKDSWNPVRFLTQLSSFYPFQAKQSLLNAESLAINSAGGRERASMQEMPAVPRYMAWWLIQFLQYAILPDAVVIPALRIRKTKGTAQHNDKWSQSGFQNQDFSLQIPDHFPPTLSKTASMQEPESHVNKHSC